MVWSLLVFALLSLAQVTYGREFRAIGHGVRNNLPRSVSEEMENENIITSNNPILYNLRQNEVRPFTEAEDSLMVDKSSEFPSLLQEEEPFLYFTNQQPSLREQMQAEADLAELQNGVRSANFNEDDVNNQERFLLQKRLQMKGMGLLGSSKPNGLLGSSKGLLGSRKGLLGSSTGRKSLLSLSKSRPKGLVLSIDLGIKALRDAILHAKVKQKNKQHHVQAQKNMRLLHTIGKRDSTNLQTSSKTNLNN